MPIPTEPIGSIPRPPDLVAGLQQFAAGRISSEQLARLQDAAIRHTIRRFEATESPVITDGEQAKPSFATYHDTSTSRDTAFAKIRSRVAGTALAARALQT